MLVKLAFRQRGIRRTRPRPNAAGNYITARFFNQVYYITFPRTEAHYIKYDAYTPPYTKAVGYVYAPPPQFPWRLLGPASDPQTAPDISDVPEPYQPAPPPSSPGLPSYPSSPIPTPPLPAPLPPGLPPGTTPTSPVANSQLFAGVLDVGVTAKPLRPRGSRSKVFTILAAPANTADIWITHHPSMGPGYGFPLAPGSSITITIDDMGKVWLRATADGQKVYFLAEA